MRLLADISSHGLGHLAQAGPVLTALWACHPELQLLVRSGLPEIRLRERIQAPFQYIAGASDFGYCMKNAVSIDLPASAAAYRSAHARWPERVAAEARLFQELRLDAVFSDVSYLPLAGAAQARIPAIALCSLNWADLFQHFFGTQSWAPPIYRQILEAYQSASVFLRTTPAMPMPELGNTRQISPLAGQGKSCKLQQEFQLPESTRVVLIAMGGIAMRLPLESWPGLPGVKWLVPAEWNCRHPDALGYAPDGARFADLLCSADAVLTKPGYGTFAEAANHAVPVLYVRREDWPEQECLIDWLMEVGSCQQVSDAQLARGELGTALETLWSRPRKPPVPARGAEEAVQQLSAWLFSGTGSRKP